MGGGGLGDGGGGEGDGGGGLGDGGGGVGGGGLSGGSVGGGGGDSLQTASSRLLRKFESWPTSATTRALVWSLAILVSVVKFTSPPKPAAKTVAPSPLTSAAASMAACDASLPGAANSSLCSPSETNTTILAEVGRLVLCANSAPTASKAAEMFEVLPSGDIWSIAALIWSSSVDHPTRVVAND